LFRPEHARVWPRGSLGAVRLAMVARHFSRGAGPHGCETPGMQHSPAAPLQSVAAQALCSHFDFSFSTDPHSRHSARTAGPPCRERSRPAVNMLQPARRGRGALVRLRPHAAVVRVVQLRRRRVPCDTPPRAPAAAAAAAARPGRLPAVPARLPPACAGGTGQPLYSSARAVLVKRGPVFY
jgi:hypothetical protein